MAESNSVGDSALRGDGVTRREAVRTIGLGVGVLSTAGWLAGCGSDAGDKKASATVKRGGVLVVGAEADAYVLSGDEANVGQYPLNANIFEGLVRMDPDYGIVPVLAESWALRDGKTWRFKLRRGVMMHNGKPFTAASAKYSFDRIAAQGGGTPGFVKGGTKVVDDHTLDVTPMFANLRLVEQIVHPEYSIAAAGTDPVKAPTGTGPFQYADYRRQQELVVKRFPKYWGGPALLDEIRFKFLPDANARRLALEGGTIGVMLGVPSDAARSLQAKGFNLRVSAPGAYEALYANVGGAKGYTLLQDDAVRHAIQYAIDRTALIVGVFDGQATADQTMVPARLLGADAKQVTGYTYDLPKAQMLLESAGWKAGDDGIRSKGSKKLELELISGFPSAAAHTGVAEFVQDQLKKAGIAVKIVKTPDDAAYSARTATLKGDLWLERGNQNDANPSFLPALLFSDKGLFGPGDYQKMFAPGGDFDEQITQALAAPNEPKVKQLVGEAMHTLIDTEAIVIPLAGVSQIAVTAKTVSGFVTHPSNLQVRYDRVGLTA